MPKFSGSNTRDNPLQAQSKVVYNHNSALNVSSVVAWSENGPTRYKDDLLRRTGWSTYMGRSYHNIWYNSPISFKSVVWRQLDSGVKQISDGEHGISGDRFVTWVHLKHRVFKYEIVVFSAHLMPMAWAYDGSAGDRPKMSRKEQLHRQAVWNSQVRIIKGVMAPYFKKGLPMVLIGDMNRVGKYHVLPRVYSGRTVYDFAWGLDHAIFINGRDKKSHWTFGKTWITKNFSDHPVITVQAFLPTWANVVAAVKSVIPSGTSN